MPKFTVPPVNGQYIFDVPDVADVLLPFHIMTLAYASAPAAGTYSLHCQYVGDTIWHPVEDAQLNPIVAGEIIPFVGIICKYRVTIAGISGGSSLEFWIASASEWIGPGMPIGLFTGTRAMTVQPYTEANVKNGVQYYLRAVWPTLDQIANGTDRKLYFKTGAKPVLVKLRELHYIAEELAIQLYINPTTVTGGTTLAIQNYNGVAPVVSTSQAKKNVTTVSDGAEFGGSDPEYFFGATTVASRTANSIPQGRERVLPANTEFIVKISNTGSQPARVQYYLDWYEGDTDLPRT